jgi:hypothetical protein
LAIADVGSSEEAVAAFEGIGILTPRCGTLETIGFSKSENKDMLSVFIFFYFIT